MLTLAATKRVLVPRLAAAAKSTTEASPLTPRSRLTPIARSVRRLSEYCGFFTSARTCASLAARRREDGPGIR